MWKNASELHNGQCSKEEKTRGNVVSIGIDTHVNAEEGVESCVLGSMEQLCRGVEKRVCTIQ